MSDSLINIEADISNAQDMLKETFLKVPTIESKVLRLVGRLTAKEINKAVKGGVHSGTSVLIAHRYPYNMNQMYVYGKPKNHEVSVYPHRVQPGRGNDLIIPVSMALNYGATIEAKEKQTLSIFAKTWARPVSITIKGRGFVQAGETYAKSSRYSKDVQKLIDRELEKYDAKFRR